MAAVYDYLDYRIFLADKLKEIREKNPRFSFRAFTRLAGLRSPGFIKRVLEGGKNLGDDGISAVVKALKLSEEEASYFETLVRFNHASRHEDKDRYFQKLRQHKRFLTAKPLTAAQYDLFSHWYYVVILEMIRMNSKEPKGVAWIQKHLYPPLSLPEIKRAVKALKALGFLVEDAGGLARKDAMLGTPDVVRSLAVANFQIKMGERAGHAILKEGPGEREFATLTVATNASGFERAKVELRKFKKKLHSILEEEVRGDRTMVGHVNLQLFKLCKIREGEK